MKEDLTEKITKIYFELKESPASLRFEYQDKDVEKNISTALSFWYKSVKIKSFEKDFWPHLMQDAVENENPMIRTIAMIELLPASVWRELLWKENIDFMSLECFLRRLNPEQAEAIKLNYLDYTQGKLPRVMKKSWRNRIKILFGRLSFKKLSQTKKEKSEKKRYDSKNAWAYNLLGLDFGFSLYPEGELSDKKITNKSFTRFLSIKEHINDFVVNKETGKYWQMYKTARSNYAFRPGKEVQMRKHVCPGFWLTLILHTLFWIVSPLAIISAATSAWQLGLSWESISPAIFALPLIGWTIIAMARFLWKIILKTMKSVLTALKSTKKDHWVMKALKRIGIVILYVIAGICIIVWTDLAIKGIRLFFKLTPVLGSLLTTLLFLSLIFYLVTGVSALNEKSKIKYGNMPTVLKFLALASVTASVIVLFDKFLTEYVIAGITYLAQVIWQWYAGNFLLNSWIIFACLFIVSPLFFWQIMKKDEVKFVRIAKIIDLLLIIFAISTALFVLAIWIRIGYINLITLGHLQVLLIAFGLIITGIYLAMKKAVNKDNLHIRENAWDIVYQLSGTSKMSQVNKLANNKKFQRLVEQDKQLFDDLLTMSLRLFHREYYRWWFMNMIILRSSRYSAKRILNCQRELIDLSSSETSDYVSMVLILMTTQEKGFSKAEKMANKMRKENQRKKEKKIATIKKRMEKVNKVITKSIHPFAFIGKKVYQFFITLKDLWDFFNKRCPYISEERELM